MNKLLSISIAALLCILTTAAMAKEDPQEQPLDWYDVEVIIFRHHDLNALSHEKWKRDPGTPDIRDARELLPPLPETLSKVHSEKLKQPLAFLQLGEDQYRLDDKLEALQNTDGYDPLIHIAWRQPGLGPDDAVAIHVHGGVHGVRAHAETPTDENGSTPETQTTPADAEEEPGLEGPPAPYIDGTIKLIRKRFLHVEADILYRAPYIDDPANPLTREQWPQAFRLTESRRMRSRELHYLDHPMFGILIVATPYEPPKPDQDAAENEGDKGTQTRVLKEKKDPLSGTIRR
jgi:hypothetical protein